VGALLEEYANHVQQVMAAVGAGGAGGSNGGNGGGGKLVAGAYTGSLLRST
jgi:hypothetical protein